MFSCTSFRFRPIHDIYSCDDPDSHVLADQLCQFLCLYFSNIVTWLWKVLICISIVFQNHSSSCICSELYLIGFIQTYIWSYLFIALSLCDHICSEIYVIEFVQNYMWSYLFSYMWLVLFRAVCDHSCSVIYDWICSNIWLDLFRAVFDHICLVTWLLYVIRFVKCMWMGLFRAACDQICSVIYDCICSELYMSRFAQIYLCSFLFWATCDGVKWRGLWFVHSCKGHSLYNQPNKYVITPTFLPPHNHDQDFFATCTWMSKAKSLF